MTTAIVPRGTSTATLNPSQSQVTAPVLEYRCMFTHDIRKKAKKWHDGSLRFHTFNRRVMVYDDTKNLVGGLHYRLLEEFAEGLELNLDTHVLVQVEEQLGESSTDLTQLLGRQKQDGTTQFARPNPPTRATLPRINAANSQIKPKSIKELLGTSQGSIGRARLPSKSPYEQRHVLYESQPAEPEFKKRKIAHGKENDVEILTSAQPAMTSKPASVKNTSKQLDSVVEPLSDDEPESPPQWRRDTIGKDSTSLDNPRLVCPPTRVTKTIRQVSPPASRSKSKKKRVSSRAEKDKTFVQKDRKSKGKDESLSNATDKLTSRTSLTSSRPPETSTTSSRDSQIRRSTGPRSSLRFAAEKSRPKLMYRALLAGSSKSENNAHEEPITRSSTSEPMSTSDHVDKQLTRRLRPTNLIDTDNLFSASQVSKTVDNAPAADLDEYSTSNNLTDNATTQVDAVDITTLHENEVPEENPEIVPNSPLFLPRGTSQICPSPSQKLPANDDPLSFLSQAVRQNGRQRRPSIAEVSPSKVTTRQETEPSSSPSFQRNTVQDPHSNEPPVDPHQCIDNDTAPSPLVNTLPQDLPSPELVQAPSTKSRRFRRVVSESIPRARTSPGLSPNYSDIDDEHLDNLPDVDMLSGSPAKVNRTRVQPQSYSDPIDAHPTTTMSVLIPSSNEDEEFPLQPQSEDPPVETSIPDEMQVSMPAPVEESGPWTSTEAFLLFDWWPPKREKPPCREYLSSGTHGGASILASNALTNESSRNPSLSKKYGTFGSAKFVSQK